MSMEFAKQTRTRPPSALARLIDRARTELAGKPRLRLGVWVVVAILMVHILLLQADWLATAMAERAEWLDQRAVVARASREQDLPAQLVTERDYAEALEQRLWHAESTGHAQAQLQRALAALAADLNFRDPRVQPGVSQPVLGVPDVFRVQARLTGGYEGVAALELLLALAEQERKLVIDRMTLNRGGRQLAITLSSYFIGISDEPTEPAP